MESSVTSAAAPHSVKRWQLGGTDYEPAAGVRSLRSGRLLSAWTPLGDKTGNRQVRGRDSGQTQTLSSFKVRPTG